jgi:TonB-dependent receptor
MFNNHAIRLGMAFILANLFMTSGISARAQDADEGIIEEVIVTGIRSSVTAAMDIKRDADGVVDSITSEDIAKFPDANLAESLQRITGVSIDRQSGEGNQVTVRGLGPNFNMVTLNGRQMPSASSPEQESIASATQSRAFNFAQIASESVVGVDIFKTAKPNLTPGGIGATIDIRTARPFDYAGTEAVFNVAAVHDASVEDGKDITPDIGGLFSTRLADGKVGLLGNFSYAERNSSEPSAHLDGWLRDDAGSGNYNTWCANADCTGVPYVYRPVANVGEIQHNDRKRTNAQLVAQFAPNERFQVTVDYVYSLYEVDQRRNITASFGVVDGNTVTNLGLDDNYTVTGYTRAGHAPDTQAYDNELKVENDSIGLNMRWDVTDRLTLAFDAHNSSAVSQPDGELNDRNYIINAPLGSVFDYTYSGSGVAIDIDDSGAYRGTCQYGIDDPTGFDFVGEIGADDYGCGRIEANGFLDPVGFSPLGSVFKTIGIDNEVDQYQLNASWDFDQTVLDFGVSWTDYQVETNAVNTGFQFQGLYPCAECDIHISAPISIDAPSAFQQVNVVDIDGFINATREPFLGQDFANLTCCGDGLVGGGNWPNPDSLLIETFPPTFFGASEESLALYMNVATDFEIGSMPARISAGLRYEDTDVKGSAFQNFPLSLTVISPTEGVVNPGPEETFFTVKGDYSVFLPAMDFRIEPAEGHVARASYGKSIARPDLNGLRPTTTVSDYRPGIATASSGNPDLNPYLSDNFDLSYEWYYGEGSYFSIAYFYKEISDYIGTSVVQDTILDVDGEPLLTPEARFDPNLIPAVPVTSEPGDPIVTFDVTRLVNGAEREVDGFEIAVQHLFGESGFGMQANYTVVDSDAEYDTNDFGEQSVLIGLSDSANLVGFFENNTFSVRVAANWRDKFLFATGQLRATNEPVYFDEYLQVDMLATWFVTDIFAVNFEVLNVFGEDQKQTGRYSNHFLLENEQAPRFKLGVRAVF